MTTDKEYARLLHLAKGHEVITKVTYIGKGLDKTERLCGGCGRWVTLEGWSIHSRNCIKLGLLNG